MNLPVFHRAVATLALLIATCSALAAQPELGSAAPTPAAINAWRVVEDRSLDVQGTMVALSPDGTHLVGLEWRNDGTHLVIQDAAGSSDLGVVPGSPFALDRGPQWADNNTILVSNTSGKRATLLTVERQS
ncbi:MAG: hypothetical protein M3457_21795 [Chloroflexota bacterium]|nr:hypothetical protein [Chloroflexota bacterium]